METMETTTAAANAEGPGYKLTKLGWLPEEWSIVRLNEVARMRTGHTPSKKKPSYYNGDIGWVSLKDTHRLDSFFIHETTVQISEEGLKNSSAVLLPENTVILTRTGSVGKSAILKKQMAVCQNHVAWICGPRLRPEFLYYTLQAAKSAFKEEANGSTLKTIGLPFFNEFQIILPTLQEQDEMAAIFIELDNLVNKANDLLAAKRTYKRGLMQLLLTGQRRFPEFQGQPWRQVQLGEVFEDFSQLNRHNEDLPILSCSKVYGIVLQEQLFGRRIASADICRYKVVSSGDLVYDPMLLWDASLGFVASVQRGVISPAYVTLRYTGDAETKALLEQVLYSEELRFQYKLISRGTNVRRQKAPAEDFLNIKLNLPVSSAERGKIAAVLSACDQETELLQAQLRQWQQQKKGLMQQLLTGRLRVV